MQVKKEMIKEVKDVSRSCPTCKIHRKPLPTPVVGLPMSNTFLETVAMDRKYYKGIIFPHIVDHCNRLSASAVIRNKQPETIIKYVFKSWIFLLGSPAKFLTDNGGEFAANSTFTSMCESLGIAIKTALVEKHNLILANMLDLELAVVWCVSAKNSLSNIHSFSPYQLAISTNPKLSSMMRNRAPALAATPSSKIICNNLKAMHKVREAFIVNH